MPAGFLFFGLLVHVARGHLPCSPVPPDARSVSPAEFGVSVSAESVESEETCSLLQFRGVSGGKGERVTRNSSSASEDPWWKQYGADASVASWQLVREMTFDEKKSLVVGLGYSWDGYDPRPGFYAGAVLGVPRLGVPATNAQDAGQGFRTFRAHQVGTVTSWPSGLAVAAAWDADLTERYASAVGREFARKGVNAVLGPGADITRVGRGGRNSESLVGEEPALGAAHVAAYVRGVQGAGVACVAKHFVMNTQETNRNTHNNIASQRERFEIHYPAFQAAMENGLAAVMCAYNGVNGMRSCQNDWLLQTELKGLMGFEGYVMSDWWAVLDKTAAATSGLDLMMPGNDPLGYSPSWDDDDLREVAGREHLDDMVRRFLHGMISSSAFDRPACLAGLDSECRNYDYDDVTKPGDAALALEVASASVVLLKNEGGLLPLVAGTRVALLGSACDKRQTKDPNDLAWNEGDYYVVGGSGRVLSPKTLTIRQALEQRGEIVTGVYSDSVDEAASLLRSGSFDVAITCGGATSGEAEDRQNLKLDQHDFIADLASRNAQERRIPLVVLTMSTGAIMTDFRQEVAGLLSIFMGGQASAEAFVGVLFGDVNPSGRLPVTFPAKESDLVDVCLDQDCPLYDGLFVGWRRLIGKPVAFPFGYGLSFTTFVSTWVQEPAVASDGTVTMSVRVANAGPRPGRDVVQLYLKFPLSAGEPERVLRGFHRTAFLFPSQSEVVDFKLSPRDLSVWQECDPNAGNMLCEARTCYGADCWTCEERMHWLTTEDGGRLSLEDARKQIVSEFPSECSQCQPRPPQPVPPGNSRSHPHSPPRANVSLANSSPSKIALLQGRSVEAAASARYVGCFADMVSDRDLPATKGQGSYEYCGQQCQGYKYFGRQWEQECFCGDSFAKHGEAADCQCESYNIGGDRNCIYEVLQQDQEAQFIGCFADDVDDRDLEVRKGNGDLEFCVRECEGFAYFGRQWEQECWCGNLMGKHGSSSSCQCDAFNIGGSVNCIYKPKVTSTQTETTTATSTSVSSTTTVSKQQCTQSDWLRITNQVFSVYVAASSRAEGLTADFMLG